MNEGVLEALVALIGVAGTLLGTFMGWLLTQISNRGKITLFLNLFTERYGKHDDDGFPRECLNVEAEYYTCKAILDIYNSSPEPGIMRDIRLLYKEGKKVAFIKKPEINFSNKQHEYTFDSENFPVINIPAKTAISIVVETYINDKDKEFELVNKKHKVILEYRTGSKKVRFRLKSNKD